MSALSGLNGLPAGIALAVRAEAFSAALAARSWAIRQKSERRAHLLLLQSDRGRASWHGTSVALEAPALLWRHGRKADFAQYLVGGESGLTKTGIEVGQW